MFCANSLRSYVLNEDEELNKSSLPYYTMSDASTTISEQYDRIVSRLGTIATDRCLLDSRLNDAIFIDDILLRLKLWAADVQHDQGSLGWAEKITEISIPLRQCLQKLDEQCELFVAALKQSEGRAGGESQSGEKARYLI
jgi:hypothetical protein